MSARRVRNATTRTRITGRGSSVRNAEKNGRIRQSLSPFPYVALQGRQENWKRDKQPFKPPLVAVVRLPEMQGPAPGVLALLCISQHSAGLFPFQNMAALLVGLWWWWLLAQPEGIDTTVFPEHNVYFLDTLWCNNRVSFCVQLPLVFLDFIGEFQHFVCCCRVNPCPG